MNSIEQTRHTKVHGYMQGMEGLVSAGREV